MVKPFGWFLSDGTLWVCEPTFKRLHARGCFERTSTTSRVPKLWEPPIWTGDRQPNAVLFSAKHSYLCVVVYFFGGVPVLDVYSKGTQKESPPLWRLPQKTDMTHLYVAHPSDDAKLVLRSA